MWALEDEVVSAAKAPTRIPVFLIAHVARGLELLQQPVDAVPAEIATLHQVVDDDLLGVRLGQQVDEKAPGRPGQALVLDRGPFDNEISLAIAHPEDAACHRAWSPVMMRVTSAAG